MKRNIQVILGICVVIVMIGSNITTVKAGLFDAFNKENKSNNDGIFDEKDMIFSIDDKSIALGSEVDIALKSMSTPISISEAKSCLYDDNNKSYTWKNMKIDTRVDDGKEIIYIVEISADYQTASGIKIGSSKDDIVKAYGSEYEDLGSSIYYEDKIGDSLTFELEQDKVKMIEFYYE